MHGAPKRRLVAWIGGVVACLVLVVAGIAYMVIGMEGRSEVQDTLAREQIVGTPDMKPGGITTDVAGKLPTCDVAGVAVDTGDEAKCFASYMRVHALEATGGQTYAEMGRYLDAQGNATSDETKAAKDPKSGRPVENPLRQLWVTETALATGLNMSFFAERVSLFAVVMGACLLVIGIGLGVLTLFTLGTTPWRDDGTTPPT
jgi:hypothetical protein